MASHSKSENFSTLHWTTNDEMLFTKESKYDLVLDDDFPFTIKFYQFSAAHPVSPNYHDFYEIGYFYSGEGVYNIGDKCYPIKAQDIIFIQNGQMHYMETTQEAPLKSVSIYFMPELVYQTGSHPFEFDYLLPFMRHEANASPVFKTDGTLGDHILNMYKKLTERSPFYQLELKNSLCSILLTFLTKMNTVPTDNRSAPMVKIKRLEHVFNFIHKHYNQSLQLEMLAEQASMSPAYFSRFFKKVTGLSPIDYILRYRIDRSKELLINTDLSITEIAFQTGFNSSSYFDKIFLRVTSLSPKQFRNTYSV